MTRISLFVGACLLVANHVSASTLVTWQAEGTVTRQISSRLVPPAPGIPVTPPIGTPVSVTFSFDPAAATPSFGSFGNPGCVTVPLSGSVTIGGFTTGAGTSAQAFTNSSIPGNTCTSSGRTEFTFFVGPAPVGEYALPPGMLIVSYFDALVQDAFPSEPNPLFLAGIRFLGNGGFEFEPIFEGSATLSALDSTTPVPEPATMMLFGIGLAAVARARKARR